MNKGELTVKTPYGSYAVGVSVANDLGEVDYIYSEDSGESPTSIIWGFIENKLGTPEEIADSLFTEQRKQAERLRNIIQNKKQIA